MLRCFGVQPNATYCFLVTATWTPVPILFTHLTVKVMDRKGLTVCFYCCPFTGLQLLAGRKDVLWGGLFGTDFWALISSTRRWVNDPFHLLPSKFGIWLHHWFFCSCWMNFTISLKEKGDGISHCCPAKPVCRENLLGQIKLHMVSFSPFANLMSWGASCLSHTGLLFWPAATLWTWEVLNIKYPLATARWIKEPQCHLLAS